MYRISLTLWLISIFCMTLIHLFWRHCASMQVEPTQWQGWAQGRVWVAGTLAGTPTGALLPPSWVRHLQNYWIATASATIPLDFVMQIEGDLAWETSFSVRNFNLPLSLVPLFSFLATIFVVGYDNFNEWYSEKKLKRCERPKNLLWSRIKPYNVRSPGD